MRKVIIRYQGGLGNQMFEFAMKLRLIEQGYVVYDDLSFYDNNGGYMPFVINEVFENVNIKNFIKSSLATKILRKFFMKTGNYVKEENYTAYNDNFLETRGWIEGYWQSYKYYEPIRNQLLNCFRFPMIKENYLKMLENDILNTNSISIHVRAGDYLNDINYANYGGICTKDYYNKAIEYIKNKVKNPVFYVFSDDLKWTKENIDILDAVYIENKSRQSYKDWMDMYFMSICKHNIIANSSFSWWGAWLNNNEDRIIICPNMWSNKYINKDVCPKEWIRIGGKI